MNRHHNGPQRFYALDILRGIAALSVVFWHWQHFFYNGTFPGTFHLSSCPFYHCLAVFYQEGNLAVDFFFCLSGFIFYWLYAQPVAEGSISLSKFAWLRFSRLYPLQLVTLLIVAIGQVWILHDRGSYFVYAYNDLKHFLLNLFFASSWGLESGYSFNGPNWSVSVEVFLYALFFMCCRRLPVRGRFLAPMAMIGFFVLQNYYFPIGRGIGLFFWGGCVFLSYQAVMASRWARIMTYVLTYFMLVLWFLTFFTQQHGMKFILLWSSHAHLQWAIQILLSSWTVLVMFPLTILSLALIETRRGHLGKRFSVLGDISYSSYMLHFPLQLYFVIVLARLGFNATVYYSAGFMVLFFVVLILLSLMSFRYFEMPIQRFLRQHDRGI